MPNTTPEPAPLPRHGRKPRQTPGDAGRARHGGAPRGGGRQPRGRRPDEARTVAFDVLRAVSGRDAYANLVLPGLLDERRLPSRDAALATELTYGTLRALGSYDAILAACVDRPLGELDPALLDTLRLGAHQVLGTRIPPHAAVATTVDLTRAEVGPGPARLANAVLRRVAGADLDTWLARLAPDRASDPDGYLAVSHAHPRWIVAALRDALAAHRGPKAAADEIAALLRADNSRPSVTLAVRPGRLDVPALLEAADAVGRHAEPARYSRYGAYLADGDPLELDPVARGLAGVQDEGSQVVTLALTDVEIDRPERRWLDMCAGPGGKAALLAGIAGPEITLLATELVPHRAGLVRRVLRAATADRPANAAPACVCVADATRRAWPDDEFDRVLLDAPCTGLGALRRRPEARWRRTADDVPVLAARQRRLLDAALAATRPGGVVAYVTCSPHLSETREVVDAVLARRTDVERLDARRYLPDVPDLGEGPDVQLWPHLHGTDAMYLALLRRR
jgi:16S rRNA (cytosine967-C5)-methyltransferase